MTLPLQRRDFLRAGAGLVAATVARPVLASLPAAPDSISPDDPRLPRVLTVEYQMRDYEVVDYDFHTIPGLPRLRFRGPRFDPREAQEGSFFTAFGSAHTMGVYSPVTYVDLLARKLGISGLNLGVGGVSASFYNSHPQLIEWANRGKFAIIQITAARMESNDRFLSTPAAQIVFDRKVGDMISPELAWARIVREEPGRVAEYEAQSRASWVREHERLLSAIEVPKILLWFSARAMSVTGGETSQIGTTSTTAFPQLTDGRSVERIRRLAQDLCVCVTSRNAGHPLISRFTGEPVSVNHRLLSEGRGPAFDMIETHNLYYASREMHEDAAACVEPAVRNFSA